MTFEMATMGRDPMFRAEQVLVNFQEQICMEAVHHWGREWTARQLGMSRKQLKRLLSGTGKWDSSKVRLIDLVSVALRLGYTFEISIKNDRNSGGIILTEDGLGHAEHEQLTDMAAKQLTRSLKKTRAGKRGIPLEKVVCELNSDSTGRNARVKNARRTAGSSRGT